MLDKKILLRPKAGRRQIFRTLATKIDKIILTKIDKTTMTKIDMLKREKNAMHSLPKFELPNLVLFSIKVFTL
jgi:hypothetical protein